MDIIQTFYDQLAAPYDKLFADWRSTTREQAALLDKLLRENGKARGARILDCACGIGTQAIGLAELGYDVTASDISKAELEQARQRAAACGVEISFVRADFRALRETFDETFDVVMAMDNALPHMLTHDDLKSAVESMVDRLVPNGLLVASIRDYDALLESKPPYSPPYIHKTEKGQRVSFQTWDWEGEHYRLVQYIIEDDGVPQVSKFACEYRATRREELTQLLLAAGCREATWLFPEETDFYQPMIVAKK